MWKIRHTPCSPPPPPASSLPPSTTTTGAVPSGGSDSVVWGDLGSDIAVVGRLRSDSVRGVVSDSVDSWVSKVLIQQWREVLGFDSKGVGGGGLFFKGILGDSKK